MKSEKLFFLTISIALHISVFGQQRNNSNWLKDIPDSTPICDINLPGSHDAAAINKHKHTPYACHSNTIPEQLGEGIRILDIRIKVKEHGSDYSFVTCHGNAFGGALHFNEYQSLASVFDECKAFLASNPSEFIVMLLKIDDWNGQNQEAMYSALDSLLFSKQDNYPIYDDTDSGLPTLGKLRGKIYLVNRDYSFGVPLTFPINTAAMVTPAIHFSFTEPDTVGPNGKPAPIQYLRSYPVYIQDQYEKLAAPAEKTKFGLVKETIAKKKKGDGMVVLNYATARQGFLYLNKVFIQDSILNYFGSMDAASRPANFGWMMLDYDSWTYTTDKYAEMNLTQLIIESNFKYAGYPDKFKVLAGRHVQ